MRLAIVVSQFNETIVNGLMNGAKQFLNEVDVRVAAEDIFLAPGAFELPLLAKNLAQTGLYKGIICLGCVIKGDTAHFEFISLGATIGIQQAALSTDTPISFGVLTVYEQEQAEVRSLPGAENKGREAAAACYETALTLSRIQKLEL